MLQIKSKVHWCTRCQLVTELATPSDAAWVLACYNSDNYVTNASKDKELSNDMDGSRARARREMVVW